MLRKNKINKKYFYLTSNNQTNSSDMSFSSILFEFRKILKKALKIETCPSIHFNYSIFHRKLLQQNLSNFILPS